MYIMYLFTFADPTHSRAQGNIDYFERLLHADPDKYIDVGGEREGGKEAGSEREMSEHERYESLCREPWPLVSAPVAYIGCTVSHKESGPPSAYSLLCTVNVHVDMYIYTGTMMLVDPWKLICKITSDENSS